MFCNKTPRQNDLIEFQLLEELTEGLNRTNNQNRIPTMRTTE